MLDINDAQRAIRQFQTQPFICSDEIMSTNDYIIVKKCNGVTTDSVQSVISKMKMAAEPPKHDSKRVAAARQMGFLK